MSNQQYNHLLQVIADLGQQMSEGFAAINARLDKLEARADNLDRNFVSIYEILQDIIEMLPKKRASAKALLTIKNSKRLLQDGQP
jgi:3-dehydroquinate dehydratase